MKGECFMQNDCSICEKAKSSIAEDQKGTRKHFFGLMFVPWFQTPWNYRKKKGRLILCNFTFMFSFSCYMRCWFVLVDILITIAEITFNCSVEKGVCKTVCEKKKTLLRGGAKHKLFKTTPVFSRNLEAAQGLQWFCCFWWVPRSLDLKRGAFFPVWHHTSSGCVPPLEFTRRRPL